MTPTRPPRRPGGPAAAPATPLQQAASAAAEEAEPFGSPTNGDDDLFEANVQEGPEVPDGIYRLRVQNVRAQESKAGNPMWVWDMMITEGEFTGEVVPLFTSLTPQARWKLSEVTKALGVLRPDPTTGKYPERVAFKKEQVVGLDCLGQIETNDFGTAVREIAPLEKAPVSAEATASDDDDTPF